MKEQTAFAGFGVSAILDNTIIAYVEGLAIAKDEWGDLYFAEMPEEFATIGEVADLNAFEPFEKLPSDVQSKILSNPPSNTLKE